ncbi:MAG: SDR family oxidoreductase [Bacilli bacterium]|nr:SDR family oxidoreductase [Bacilli bacterium]
MYKDKIVLVTGSSKGIGKAIIEFFAKNKANIIMTYNTSSELSKRVKEEIQNVYHVKVNNYHLDLQDVESINSLYEIIKKEYGHIDILVNNAALSIDNDFDNLTKEDFMKVFEVNTVGTFLMIKYMSKLMNKDSFIFNISSTDGIDTGSTLSINYNVSKAGINNMTETLSRILKPKIVTICPNWVDTETIHDMNQEYLTKEMKRINQVKLIKKEKIPEVINELITNEVVSGSIIRIDGDINE